MSGSKDEGLTKLQTDFSQISCPIAEYLSCSERLAKCSSVIAALQELPHPTSMERGSLLRDALRLKKSLLDDVQAENIRDLSNSTLDTLQSLKAEERGLRDRLEENLRLQASLQEDFHKKALQWAERNEVSKGIIEVELMRVIQEILNVQRQQAFERQALWTLNSQRLQSVTLHELCWMPGEQLRGLAEQVGMDLSGVAERSDMVHGIVKTLSTERHTEMGRTLGLHIELAKGTPLDLLRPYIRRGCRVPPLPPTFPESAVPTVNRVTDRSVILSWPQPLDVPPHSKIQFKVHAKLLYPLDHPSADLAQQWRLVQEAVQENMDGMDVYQLIGNLIPGASYVFRVECVTVHSTPATTGASRRVTMLSEFQPTDEWQEVLQTLHGFSQPVPAGCHIRSDLDSGRTLARRR